MINELSGKLQESCDTQQKKQRIVPLLLYALVGQVGLEPTMVKPADLQSAAIAARRLTHMVEPAGIEPATPRFSVWRSTD